MLNKLSQGIAGIFAKARLDQAALNALEELLIEADAGVKASGELAQALSKQKFDKDISPQEVKKFLAGEIAKKLAAMAKSLPTPLPEKTMVIVVVGANGSGKTTTIGKLAARYQEQGTRVMLAAADTFRAAAVEQLQEWGRRLNVPVVAGAPGSDPASVAYKAAEEARAAKIGVLLVDTAGRLANKAGLMAELQKILRALKKIDETAPHHVLQVVDASIGRNTAEQVKMFHDMAQTTGLIITKLDGTAKGGVLLSIADLGLPLHVHALGTGEGRDDLLDFQPADFAGNMLGM